MKLAELIAQSTWLEVKAALLWNYHEAEESLEGYRDVLANLKQLSPSHSEMRIVVCEISTSDFNESPHMMVVGRNGDLNREQEDFQHFQHNVDEEFANSEVDFSLSFQPWEEWLGSEVDRKTLEEFPRPEIVAHCIWDMTFHGFEQAQVQAALAELKRRADEIDAMTEEQREKVLIPHDEVQKRLEYILGGKD